MKAIIQHLRFPFSILLMPVFLFALFSIHPEAVHSTNTLLLFMLLHLLVYPSSNAFNSTQDRDDGSVGLIRKPLPVPSHLVWITILMDVFAILLVLFINQETTILLAVYIIFSRLYSWRRIRLKKHPVTGFLIVFVCQGALVFFMVRSACSITVSDLTFHTAVQALIASLLIGSIYPLSQIYQHRQDQQDGVITISFLLGYRNTFLFSGLQFLLASLLMAYIFMSAGQWTFFLIFSLFQIPVIIFFVYWFWKVMNNNAAANYKNSMYMNLISAFCMNLCFFLLLWFRN